VNDPYRERIMQDLRTEWAEMLDSGDITEDELYTVYRGSAVGAFAVASFALRDLVEVALVDPFARLLRWVRRG